MGLPKNGWRFVGLGGLFLLLGTIFSVGYHHPDEHFQIIEFALQKLGRISDKELPWEFKEEMRPALQPILAMVGMNGCELIGISSPFTIAFFLRLVSAGFAFYGMLRLCKGLLQEVRETKFKQWFLFLSFNLWFWSYSAIRFSSENWSASCFVWGFVLLMEALRRGESFEREVEDFDWGSWLTISKLIISGVLLGLSFVFRFQLVLMIGGLMGWLVLVRKTNWRQLGLVILGIVFGIGVGALADRYFYGHWVNTFWNYYIQNIVLHKAAGFGVSPWYFFMLEFINRTVPPFSLVMMLVVALFFVLFWKHPITWCLVPFLLVHFMIGHKEVRFLFPAFAFFPFMLVGGWKSWTEFLEGKRRKWGKWGSWRKKKELRGGRSTINWGRWEKGFVGLFVTINTVALIGAMGKPASDKIGLFKAIYDSPREKETNVYFVERNPYQELNFTQHFYFRKGLNMIQVAKEAVFLPNPGLKKGLVIFDRASLPNASWRKTHRLVYASLPAWVSQLDWNGWVERSDGYWVYETSPNL